MRSSIIGGSRGSWGARSVVLLLIALLVPLACVAQVPAIAEIPQTVPPAARETLHQTRKSLFEQRSRLQTRSREHNQKCGSVIANSAEAAACQTAQEQLQSDIQKYAEAVTLFNEQVAEAVATGRVPVRAGAAGAVAGDVFVVAPDGSQKRLKSGSNILLGSHIVGGPTARLEVMLADETVFTLGPNCDIVLDELAFDPAGITPTAIVWKMTKGTLRWVTGKIATKDLNRMKVKTPVMVAGVRGTDFEIRYLPGETGYLKLHSGQVEITETKSGRSFTLEPGQMITIGADGAIGSPTPLQ